MKKWLLILLPFVCAPVAHAQCDFYFFQSNKTITMGIFDRKDKQDGKIVYKTSQATRSGNSSTVKFTAEFFDKKNKSNGASEVSAECKNGVYLMDMQMLIPSMQNTQFENTEAKASGTFLEYPSKLTVGEDLKDSKFDLNVTMKGGLAAQVSVKITKRKVEAQEKITTPAGTWNAYKITYHSETRINMGFSIPVRIEMTEWFVPGFGMIRSQSKQGKTELLSIE